MTKARKAVLDSVLGTLAFKDAVNALYNAPRNIVKRTMRTFAVRSFSSDLDALPAEVMVPTALRSKVYFDASAKNLCCVGVLTTRERETLLNLSGNSAYQAAVNALYNAPLTESTDLPIFLTEAEVDALFDSPAAAGDLDDPQKTSNERFGVVLRTLLPYLRTTLSEQFVAQQVSVLRRCSSAG